MSDTLGLSVGLMILFEEHGQRGFSCTVVTMDWALTTCRHSVDMFMYYFIASSKPKLYYRWIICEVDLKSNLSVFETCDRAWMWIPVIWHQNIWLSVSPQLSMISVFVHSPAVTEMHVLEMCDVMFILQFSGALIGQFCWAMWRPIHYCFEKIVGECLLGALNFGVHICDLAS